MITYDPLIRLIPIPFREKRNLVSEAIRETLHSGRGQPPEFHAPWLHNIHKQPIRRIRNDWNEYKKTTHYYLRWANVQKIQSAWIKRKQILNLQSMNLTKIVVIKL